LSRLFATARASVVLGLIVANTLVWAVPIYIGIFLKLVLPRGAPNDAVRRSLIPLAETWIRVNNAILRTLVPLHWDIRGIDGLRPDGRYLVNANHQTWADVLVLQRTFNRVVPFLKFFIKQELIWVPVLGIAWWGLEFPFMKRYSSATLAAHPELRGKDLETTRRMCESLGNQPLSIMNFLEGTRFREDKHVRQSSPYRYLLRPKAGGIAFVLGAIGDSLDAMLDVTIIYDGEGRSFWDFLSGRVRRVVVDVRERRIPPHLVARDYYHDESFREEVQSWVRELWEEKDRLIDSLRVRHDPDTKSRRAA
jgi:1-acyl-sn-glycerol-3-phosphate acyltransferase